MNEGKLDGTGRGEGRMEGDTWLVAGVPGWMVVLLSNIWKERGRGKKDNGLTGPWYLKVL